MKYTKQFKIGEYVVGGIINRYTILIIEVFFNPFYKFF